MIDINSLSAKSRRVVEYALAYEGRPMTLKSIGQQFGISRQRVHQILDQAGIRNIFLRPEIPKPVSSPRPKSKKKAAGRTRGVPRPRGYLPTKLPEIAALRAQGISLHAISRVFDYDRATIRKALRAYLAGEKNIWRKKAKKSADH